MIALHEANNNIGLFINQVMIYTVEENSIFSQMGEIAKESEMNSSSILLWFSELGQPIYWCITYKS